MNWIKAWIIAAIIVALCLIASEVRAYDKTQPKEELSADFNATFTHVRITALGTAEGLYYDKDRYRLRETFWMQKGSGFVVKDGYILTAAHVVIPDRVETQESSYSVRISEPLRVISRTILIHDYKDTPFIGQIYYIDEEVDTAIISYKKNDILKPMLYDVEYYHGLVEEGDIVCSLVHERDENGSMDYNLKLIYGKVIAPRPILPCDDNVSWFNLFDVTLDLPIIPGDSGSAVFAFKDGTPVIIGIARAIHMGQIKLSYMVRIPTAMKYIEAGE
jgi:hypothetical protein